MKYSRKKINIKYITIALLCLVFVLNTASLCGCVFFDPSPGTQTETDSASDEPTERQPTQQSLPQTDPTGATDITTAEPTEAPTQTVTETTQETQATEITKETETAAQSSNSEHSTEASDVQAPSIVDTSSALYTYESMVEDLIELAEEYPEHFSYREIGVSCDGRPIYTAILGSGSASRQIIADAGTHGREYLTPMLVMATLEYYLKNFDRVLYGDKTVEQTLADTDLYVVPMMNPDGITISQFGAAALKTEQLRDNILKIYEDRRASGDTYYTFEQFQLYWKANARGVDINRNFNVTSSASQPENEASSSFSAYPNFAGYGGEEPESEPETQAYVALVESLSNPIACISIHSQGSLIYWDCGQDYSGRVSALELAGKIKAATGYPLYYAGSFTAASSDWCMIIKGIPSVTIETGTGVCPLPLSQFELIFEACKNVFLSAA